MSIVTLEETKEWLRVDGTDDDITLTTLIGSAETYIKNGTGNTFDETNDLAKIACLILIKSMYDNGSLFPEQKALEMIKPIIQQLTFCYGGEVV